MRIHSFAVWSSVVFFLNVLAFLMMGLQAHAIVSHLERGALLHAAGVSAAVVLAVVMTRIAFFLGWSRLSTRFSALRGKYPIASLGQATVVGWSGMRGIVTLATAFALPSDFPQRNLVVLVAFAVVLATLVLQGLTLAPLIRLLGVDRLEDPAEEMRKARQRLSTVAAHRMRELPDGEDLSMSELHRLEADPESRDACSRIDGHRRLALEVVRAQREELARMRGTDDLDVDTFHALMEELDWRELTHLPAEDRRLEKI